MLAANVHWVRDRTGPRGKAPVAWQLKLTHFVDDHLDVLLDIGRHFSNHGGGAVPRLYLVPTTSWDDHNSQVWQSFIVHTRAQSAARNHTMHFASDLSKVPLPPLMYHRKTLSQPCPAA
jgi:hypothetical protein